MELRSYGIRYLYHITHLRNLKSIATHGLLSHNRAHTAHSPADISGPDVQERRARRDPIYQKPLHDYVPLYFRARNPMLYRRRDRQSELAVLCVDRRVMQNPGVIFTDGNAASNRTSFYSDLTDLDKLDWDCLKAEYWPDFEDGGRKRCAEVLVPELIPFDAVGRIVVQNEDARAAARAATSSHLDIPVKPEWFF